MYLKQVEFYSSLVWLRVIALICLLGVSFGVFSTEPLAGGENKTFKPAQDQTLYKTSNPLKKITHKPWYTKMDYFVSVRKDRMSIGMPKTIEPDSNLFTISSEPTDLSFTAGGNLFNRTSVYAEIMMNSNLYTYNQPTPQVQVKSKESRADILVEHDFGESITFGFDVYYAKRTDEYNIQFEMFDQKIVQKYADNVRVLGGDLMASRTFQFNSSDVRLDYNFSYWQSNVNGIDISRKFHNLALSFYNQWSHNMSTIVSAQAVYFPGEYFVLTENISDVYLAAAEIRYRLGGASEVTLGLERLNFGERSHINTLSLRFEYQFGINETKRRKRRYKIPKPLFRIRGLLH